MIVDTNVLIRLMQDNEPVKRKIGGLEEENVPLSISSVSLFELHHSLERVSNPNERRRAIDAVLESKPTYPADSTVMKKRAASTDGSRPRGGQSEWEIRLLAQQHSSTRSPF